MNTRTINLALHTAAATLAAAAALALVAGIFLPLATPDAPVAPPAPSIATANASRLPPADSFAPLFARTLQAPPAGDAAAARPPGGADAPPAVSLAPSAAPPAAAAQQLTLVGTIGDSLALVRGPDGTTAMVEKGDDIDGVPVLAVRPSQVDLRVNGKTLTLQMPAPPDDRATFAAP